MEIFRFFDIWPMENRQESTRNSDILSGYFLIDCIFYVNVSERNLKSKKKVEIVNKTGRILVKFGHTNF